MPLTVDDLEIDKKPENKEDEQALNARNAKQSDSRLKSENAGYFFVDEPAVQYFLLIHLSLDVSYSLSVTIDILNVKNNSTPEKYKWY